VGASVIGLFFHFGSLLVVTFSLFIKPLSEQFNWTRTQVSLAFTLACLTALSSMLVVGWLTDRFGARRLIIISMSLFGALFAALSLLTPQLWFLYAVFAILGLLGPGTSAVPHASLISRWFTSRRGLALGVMMLRDRVLEAAEYIPLNQLGSADDCGFSPFGDDTSTSRETAFEKIRAGVAGTEMASLKLGA
jgi:MFS family permease